VLRVLLWAYQVKRMCVCASAWWHPPASTESAGGPSRAGAPRQSPVAECGIAKAQIQIAVLLNTACRVHFVSTGI
jgi:hypothetical protein